MIGGAGVNGKEMPSVECLQRLKGKWKAQPDMPKKLVHPMPVSNGQYIYVFGGTDMAWRSSQSVFVYGTNSRSWQTLANMPKQCKFGSAVAWKDKIYIVGGFKQSCMCYDPVLAQWSTLSQCRHEHADGPALVWKDRILVCGGRSWEAKRVYKYGYSDYDDDDGDDDDRDDYHDRPDCTSVIEEYDPETDTWAVSEIELPQKLCLHFVFSTETYFGVKTD